MNEISQCQVESIPVGTRCSNEATRTVRYACVHEHIADEQFCDPCYDTTIEGDPTFCTQCYDGPDSHECQIFVLAAA